MAVMLPGSWLDFSSLMTIRWPYMSIATLEKTGKKNRFAIFGLCDFEPSSSQCFFSQDQCASIHSQGELPASVWQEEGQCVQHPWHLRGKPGAMVVWSNHPAICDWCQVCRFCTQCLSWRTTNVCLLDFLAFQISFLAFQISLQVFQISFLAFQISLSSRQYD